MPSLLLFSSRWALLSILALLSLNPATTAEKEEDWKWKPDDDHPCTVKRMTMQTYLETFGSDGIPAFYPDPLVVTMDKNIDSNGNNKVLRNEELRRRSQEDTIVSNFPTGFNVTLSSSNSFSEHRRTIPLELYLQEMKVNHATTSPHALSNQSWYLFGETFTDPWKQLLEPTYQLPPCQTCQSQYVALSFGIGNKGSGVQWHIHGPGFSEALHGRKHWILYPPHYKPPHFHHDQSTRNWMEYSYTNDTLLLEYLLEYKRLNSDEFESLYPVLKDGRPYECTLEPGDLIYFPDRFHHATINCDPYTAFVSTFTADHLYLQDADKEKKSSGRKTAVTFGSEL